MVTTILLIRHGETDWNFHGRWQGYTDIPLNEMGHRQARLLAERLACWPIRHIYTSDLQRAQATAEHVGHTLNLTPIVDARWRERGLGVVEGLTSTEIHEKYPELTLHRSFVETPGSEMFIPLKTRLLAAYHAILEQHPGEITAVITHGVSMRVLISHLLGLPDYNFAPFSLRGNTGISRLDIGEHGCQLTLLNDTGHLEGDPAVRIRR